MFLTTYLMSRGSADEEAFLPIVRDASDRYITTSVTAWEFARGKLRGDPVYRAIVSGALLPERGTIVDIGCGQGLTLAALVDAERFYASGQWPARWPPPPLFERKVGVELRRRAAAVAREALESSAEIIDADVRTLPPIACDAALYLDVLHMIPYADQEELLATTVASLRPGGVILVRDVDAAAGWRFQTVRFGNRLKALAFGSWRQRFFFRTVDEWRAVFAKYGLATDLRPMSTGVFANVLFRLTRAAS
jgi:SAM-dependent methyltransferase